MQIETLREFLELSQSLNYRAAAKTLHMSQSALSSHITKLEQEIGSPLFVRNPRQTKLTYQGKMLVEHACKLINLHDEALRALRAASISQELIFARSESPKLQLLFTNVAAKLKKECSWVSIAIKDISDRGMLASFEAEEIDCFALRARLGCLKDRFPDLPVTEVMIGQYPTHKIRVPASSRLATKNVLTSDDLRGLSFIMPTSPGLELARIAMEDFLESLSFDPRVIRVPGDNVDELRIASIGKDVACLIPQDSVELPSFVKKDVDTGTPLSTCVYVRADKKRPELQKLVRIFAEEAC